MQHPTFPRVSYADVKNEPFFFAAIVDQDGLLDGPYLCTIKWDDAPYGSGYAYYAMQHMSTGGRDSFFVEIDPRHLVPLKLTKYTMMVPGMDYGMFS